MKREFSNKTMEVLNNDWHNRLLELVKVNAYEAVVKLAEEVKLKNNGNLLESDLSILENATKWASGAKNIDDKYSAPVRDAVHKKWLEENKDKLLKNLYDDLGGEA